MNIRQITLEQVKAIIESPAFVICDDDLPGFNRVEFKTDGDDGPGLYTVTDESIPPLLAASYEKCTAGTWWLVQLGKETGVVLQDADWAQVFAGDIISKRVSIKSVLNAIKNRNEQ